MQKKSLYVHVPFCVSKCLFCSFAIAIGQAHRVDDYVVALENEIQKYNGTSVATVYFGGGTPTFLSERQIGKLTDVIRSHFKMDDDAEWTIEANPEHLNVSKAKFLKSIGFNRLSIGLQTFEDRFLKFLGRNHDRETALSAFCAAREAGFDNINCDLMFSFPGQTEEQISRDVRTLGELKSEHVSLYGLTIDEKSRFYAQRLKLDDQQILAAQYVLICKMLKEEGFLQYEVSNFCREGRESVHNSNYWDGSPYIGIGMGAHSYLGHRRHWNVSKLNEYLLRIQNARDAMEGFEDLSPQTRLLERILFGLRKNEGVNLDQIQADVGLALDQNRLDQMQYFIDDGFLVRIDGRIRTTLKGRLVLDEICSRLI